MIRSEAMERAIGLAQWVEGQSRGGFMTPEHAAPLVRLGEFWLGIADRLPDVEPDPPEPDVVLPAPPDDDEDYTTARCGHGSTVLFDRGGWLHVLDMAECDNPPTRGEPE